MKSGRVIHHEIHHSFIDPVRKLGCLRDKAGGKHFFHRRIVNMIHINIIVFPGTRNLFVADLYLCFPASLNLCNISLLVISILICFIIFIRFFTVFVICFALVMDLIDLFPIVRNVYVKKGIYPFIAFTDLSDSVPFIGKSMVCPSLVHCVIFPLLSYL